MTLPEILTVTRDAGIRLEVRGQRLHVEAPTGSVTTVFRAELLAHKWDLLVVLWWRLEAMRRLALEAPKAVVCARPEARGGPGHCFSCGDLLVHPEAYGRCGPCEASPARCITRRARPRATWRRSRKMAPAGLAR